MNKQQCKKSCTTMEEERKTITREEQNINAKIAN
jgi:hypothetical protein